MLPTPDLLAVLAETAAATFDRVLYRAVHLEALFGFHRVPPYPQPQPLFSLGAPAHGARFTPRGGPASLYLAEDTETAIAEANQISLVLRHLNPSAPLIEPTVIVSVTAHLASVLDLTDPQVQQALGTDTVELTSPWRVAPSSALPPT